MSVIASSFASIVLALVSAEFSRSECECVQSALLQAVLI